MKKTVSVCAVASAVAMMGAARDSMASAFALYEQGASGMGNAYAGAAAAAEDATTVWWNPAGMSRLGAGKHFAIAAAAILPSTKFENTGSTTATLSNPALNGNGGDAGKSAILPSAFFVMNLTDRVNFGAAINTPFGLKTEYDSTWIGRFQGISSEVKTVNVNAALSYKFSDAASIGGGINYQHGEVNLLTAVNYSAAAFSAGGAGALGAVGGPGVEGQNRTEVDGDAWGFNIGTLFNVTPVTRVGIHYRSELKYNLEGTTNFSSVPAAIAASPLLANGNVKLDIKTPDSLAFAAAHRVNDRLELLADATWWHWSKLQQLPVIRADGPISGTTVGSPLTFNFRDTWRIALGANYKMSGPWALKFGVAYDQTPVPNAESRSVRLPDSDRYWLSAGAKYQISRSDVLDFGYTFVGIRNADINSIQNTTTSANGNVVGTYKARVNVFGIQYQHTF